MRASIFRKGALAVAIAAIFGVAFAQSTPPNSMAKDPAVGAGQRSTQNTPMGSTGTPGGATGSGTSMGATSTGSTTGGTSMGTTASTDTGAAATSTTSTHKHKVKHRAKHKKAKHGRG